jgi:hypothetical protein
MLSQKIETLRFTQGDKTTGQDDTNGTSSETIKNGGFK